MNGDIRRCLSDETNWAIRDAQERDQATEPMTNEMANALLTGVMHDNMSWMREHND